jgi:hypothetical protein
MSRILILGSGVIGLCMGSCFAATATRSRCWYRQTIELDRARVARINAAIAGQPVPESTDPATRIRDAFVVAMRYDADLFRAFAEITGLLTLPREVMGRPGIVESFVEVAHTHEALAPPGPSRLDILRLLG